MGQSSLMGSGYWVEKAFLSHKHLDILVSSIVLSSLVVMQMSCEDVGSSPYLVPCHFPGLLLLWGTDRRQWEWGKEHVPDLRLPLPDPRGLYRMSAGSVAPQAASGSLQVLTALSEVLGLSRCQRENSSTRSRNQTWPCPGNAVCASHKYLVHMK
jgi:hypothetical protein